MTVCLVYRLDVFHRKLGWQWMWVIRRFPQLKIYRMVHFWCTVNCTLAYFQQILSWLRFFVIGLLAYSNVLRCCAAVIGKWLLMYWCVNEYFSTRCLGLLCCTSVHWPMYLSHVLHCRLSTGFLGYVQILHGVRLSECPGLLSYVWLNDALCSSYTLTSLG